MNKSKPNPTIMTVVARASSLWRGMTRKPLVIGYVDWVIWGEGGESQFLSVSIAVSGVSLSMSE